MRTLPQEKQKKKSRKERQRERQRAQEAYETQRAREAQKRPRKWPKGKIAFAALLIGLLFVAYIAWQYYQALPPAIGGTTDKPPPTGSAPDFVLYDINGNQFTLSQHSGKVVAIHFMAVGCGGGIYLINENHLKALKNVCNTFCSKQQATIVTVAAATCANSNLEKIRTDHGVGWTLGNDYSDGTMDIIDAYVQYSIRDGTIVLIDKAFNVVNVYTKQVTGDILVSRISQLL